MRQPSRRLLTALWLVAAGLAFVAFAIGYYRKGEVDWVPLIATLLLAAVGISSARRKDADANRSPAADRETGPPPP